MKKTILPALAMLIVAAVMLSTASYAWFAMGTQVSATDMNVSIKSDSSFLMISKSPDLTTIRNDKLTNIEIDNDPEADLLPIAFDESKIVTADRIASFDTLANWYYMSSESPDSAVGDTDTKVSLKAPVGEEGDDDYVAGDDFGHYVYSQKFYIAIADGSNTMENLKAKVSIKAGDAVGDEALRVVIVTDEAYKSYQLVETSVGSGEWTNVDAYDSTIFAADITDDEVIEVAVYIYYDGNDSSVYTNGIGSIADSTVNVYFTASVGAES